MFKHEKGSWEKKGKKNEELEVRSLRRGGQEEDKGEEVEEEEKEK